MHDFKTLVEQFENRLLVVPRFRNEPETLYEPCRYLLALGGKRIRPVLCLMATELFSEISDNSWQAAIAIELFHNFTLIHDDIMDKAPLRRGQPTIHARNGLTAGILCGDAMCIAAYQYLAKVNTNLPEILELFSLTAMEVCEGQQLDMDFEKKEDVSVSAYVEMIGLKTAVLVAASLKIGAILGGTSAGNSDKLYAFGKSLGIAFQLQDDYLDAFGETGKIGKQNGGDILANKKTYLFLKAMENLSPGERENLHAFSVLEGQEKIDKTLAVFRAAGADLHCRQAVENYSQKAFKALEDLACTNKRKEPLRQLAEMLLNRQF